VSTALPLQVRKVFAARCGDSLWQGEHFADPAHSSALQEAALNDYLHLAVGLSV